MARSVWGTDWLCGICQREICYLPGLDGPTSNGWGHTMRDGLGNADHKAVPAELPDLTDPKAVEEWLAQ